MHIEIAERTLLASGTADALLTYDVERERGHLQRFAIDLPELAVSQEGSRRELPGGVRVHAQRFSWQGLGAQRFQSRLELQSGAIEPLLPVVISSSIVRALASLLLHFGKTHAVVDLNRTPAALELRLEEATSGTVRADGSLRSEASEDHPCGSFFVRDGPFGTGIVLARGATTVSPFVSSKWWRERPPLTSCGPKYTAAARPAPSDHAVARSDVK